MPEEFFWEIGPAAHTPA